MASGYFGFRQAIFAVGALVASCVGGQAQTLASLPPSAEPTYTAGNARPIQAWVDFCDRHPVECAVRTSEPETIRLDARTWQTIASVNRKVNAELTPATDLDHLGIPDRWDLPTDGYGDCEDYQLLKRKRLADAGLPRRAMRMTVVIDEKNEGHAVLMVRTDRGDFILDNKTDRILSWHQTGYTYVKREGHDSSAWVSLGGATSPVATANR